MESLCSRLRELVQDCIDKHLTTSAIFYADKLVTFSGSAPADVYLLVQAYFAARQFQRALSLLRTSNVVEQNAEFTYLAGCCLAEAGEWEEVLALLGDDEADQEPTAAEDSVLEPPGGGAGVRVQAGMACLRGRAFEALENRGRAAIWYKAALRLDPYCYDAFAALVDGHLLTNEEEVALVEGLRGRLAEGDRWLELLMRVRCKKYFQPEVVEEALRELEAPAAPAPAADAEAATSHQQTVVAEIGTGSGALDPEAAAGGGAAAAAASPIPYMTPPRGVSRSGVEGGSGSNTGTPGTPGGGGGGGGSHGRRGGRGTGARRGARGATTAAAAAVAAAGQETPYAGGSGDERMDDAPASGAHHPHPHHHYQTPHQAHAIHDAASPETAAALAAPLQRRAVVSPADGAGGGGGGGGSGGYGCGLGGNVDVLTCRAELLFHKGEYEAAYALTRAVLLGGSDPYAMQLLPVHIAAGTQLACSGAAGAGPRNDLFLLGHRLTHEHPDLAVSWYAVGCYYLAARQPEAARRYLGRATQLQRGFAPAWLAYGHAFSAQDERDQAMSAYRTAARLFPGLHTPQLGLGAEYCATASLLMAERALLLAYDICPNDPAVCHELGVLMYKCGQVAAAAMWLDRALALVPGGKCTVHWEATLVALGHCMRKLCRFADAARCYGEALALAPASPGTLAALGLVAQLSGDPRVAVERYHAALALRPDDPFTADMLREYAEMAAAEEEAAAAAAGGPGKAPVLAGVR
ncbi:hypothetical protein GPECTOR_13g668 [Gonium pectorale]|uniref:Uncharacterized protein n=1 Tax=Gonium pectorale TaxID=33097 RepID=A0A150GN13_GONPE|nr:hypothetical protein GPECTOR_13g668 [Gonium pectorale]|eukprot:KXZ51181.1 hypothetical protein GPECTOR_13g668 [Gonium pectorale]